MKCLRKKQAIMLEKEDIEVDEGIGTYYECVPAFTRKAMVAEELYNRKLLGLTSMTDEQLYKLQHTKAPVKREDLMKMMEGPPDYNMLTDMRYIKRFAYVAIEQRNTLAERKMNNFLSLMVNYAERKPDAKDIVFRNIPNTKSLIARSREGKKVHKVNYKQA
jgi:hypothetical protein